MFADFQPPSFIYLFSTVCKWIGSKTNCTTAYWRAEHVFEVRTEFRAVSAQLQSVDPCSQPTIFEQPPYYFEWLAVLRYIKYCKKSHWPHGPACMELHLYGREFVFKIKWNIYGIHRLGVRLYTEAWIWTSSNTFTPKKSPAIKLNIFLGDLTA